MTSPQGSRGAFAREKKRRFHMLRLHTLMKYFRTGLEAANARGEDVILSSQKFTGKLVTLVLQWK